MAEKLFSFTSQEIASIMEQYVPVLHLGLFLAVTMPRTRA